MVGSTALASSDDPEHTRVLLDRFYDAMTEEIAATGGTVEKFAGDAVMAVFGVPVAREDHAGRALHTALAMLARMQRMAGGRLQLRIGINVFVKGNLYASPDVIDFGEVAVAQVAELASSPLLTITTTVRKREGVFAIKSIRSDAAALEIERGSSEPSASVELKIRLDPERLRPGSLDGSIWLETDDPESPVLTIPVRGVAR